MRARSERRFTWRATTTARPATPPPPPIPQPRTLVEVIGIGATAVVQGIALTLLSVERYEEGLIVSFRMVRHRGRVQMDWPYPSLLVTVAPAGSVPYRVLARGGSGGGTIAGEIEYRLSYAVAPAPPAGALDLSVEVSEIAWERTRGTRAEIVSRDPGPWRFSVRSAKRGPGQDDPA